MGCAGGATRLVTCVVTLCSVDEVGYSGVELDLGCV